MDEKRSPNVVKTRNHQAILYYSMAVSMLLIALSITYYFLISKPRLEREKRDFASVTQRLKDEKEEASSRLIDAQKNSDAREFEQEMKLARVEKEKQDLEAKNKENAAALQLEKFNKEWEQKQNEKEQTITQDAEQQRKERLQWKKESELNQAEREYKGCISNAYVTYQREWKSEAKRLNEILRDAQQDEQWGETLPSDIVKTLDTRLESDKTMCKEEYARRQEAIKIKYSE
jgi:hypothetical protein